jgi:7-carboxy-7-deazaguanine synthase
MLSVCELFKSIQGESTRAGEVCAFVRLSGCNLSCAWCDTGYAGTESSQMSIDRVCTWVENQHCRLAEITGGEPLLQPDAAPLAERLCNGGFTVLVETNGTQDISVLPSACVRIVDVKCPSSGMADRFLFANIEHLRSHDECKFVIADRRDFDWAQDFCEKNDLVKRSTVLFSPVHSTLAPGLLAEWMLENNTGARLGLQLHKYLWPNAKRGR